MKFNSLRKRAERLLKQAEEGLNGTVSADFSLNFDELMHELEVHQLELEMQHNELQESHQQLHDSRREYVDLFDFAPIGYAVTDDKGVILNVNLTLADMFGLNRMEIEGRYLAKFISTEDTDRYYESRQRVFSTNRPQMCEVMVQLPFGKEFFARLDMTVISQQKACRVAVTDMTPHREAEQAVQSALKHERELSDLKSRLLDTITHEFHTPLSIILSSTDLLDEYMDKMDADDKKRHHQVIKDYVWHLTRIVDEVARAYRSQEGALRVHLTTFDCRTMIADVVDSLELISPNRLQFAVVERTQTDYMIEFDKTLLRQILINVINNGVKYSESTVKITLQMLAEDFVIRVSDGGLGIPEEDQKYVFDTFFRAKNVDTISGAGIGLSVAKRLVEGCRGTIELESVLHQGTKVTMSFPRRLLLP